MTHDPQSRKRALTPEEAELWQLAMRQAKALRRRDRDIARGGANGHAGGEAKTIRDAGLIAPEKQIRDAGLVAQDQQVLEAHQGPPTTKTASKSPPPLSAFDERQRRKISRDASLIEARIDLHGMRQTEAHGALVMFLRNSAARGVRNVLVITGKGTVAFTEPRERDFYREERGVLRRLVPQWLAGHELRGIVVSYTASHTRHGGDGALYVRLRKVPSR